MCTTTYLTKEVRRECQIPKTLIADTYEAVDAVMELRPLGCSKSPSHLQLLPFILGLSLL